MHRLFSRRHLGSWSLVGSLAAASILVACTASVESRLDEDEQIPPSESPAGVTPASLPDPASCTETVPLAQARRITREEYKRSVEAAFGFALPSSVSFPPDPRVRGMDNNSVALAVSSTLAREYLEAGEAISAKAVETLAKTTACAEDQVGSETCARAFIQSKGRLLWRRTLSKSEQDAVYTLFTQWAAMPGSDVPTAYRVVVERLLGSPHFLYRAELGSPGAPGETVVLAPFELASRISGLIFGSPPDASLIEAAESGQLSESAALRAKVDAMLQDPRAQTGVRDFHDRVFSISSLDGLEKNATLYPTFSKAPSSMKEELFRLTDAAWAKGDMASLYNTTNTFADSSIAELYGATVSGQGFQPLALNASQRRGILTTPGMMAILAKSNASAPVRRGAFIREMVFCQHLEAPSGLEATPPPETPGLTIRQRLEEHRKNPACAGCHKLMDPIGLAFEHLDAVGRWRDTENKLPIDPSGELTNTDIDGTFSGGAELGAKIAESKIARTCYSMQMFRWTMGRIESQGDACTVAKIADAFIKSGNNPKALVHALVQSAAFRNVRLPEATP